MIQGAENGSNFIVKHYKEEEAKDIFKNYMTNKWGSEWTDAKSFDILFVAEINQLLILVFCILRWVLV